MLDMRLEQLKNNEERKENEDWFKPLIELGKKHYINFSDKLLGDKLFYKKGRYRYFIFTMDIGKFIVAQSNFDHYYIDKVRYCNKRKDIGPIINLLHGKFIIVYYSTSKTFRFYIHFKSQLKKLTPNQLGLFNYYSIERLLLYSTLKEEV